MADGIHEEFMVGYITGSSEAKGNSGCLSELRQCTYDVIHSWYYKVQNFNNEKRKYRSLSLFDKLKYRIDKKKEEE